MTEPTNLIKRINVARVSPVRKVGIKEAKSMMSSAAAIELVSGFPPIPKNDLVFKGGKTLPNLNFYNFYVGNSGLWDAGDKNSIDSALAAALSDKNLNNVMIQYFPGHDNITSTLRGSQSLSGNFPERFYKDDVEKLVNDLFSQGKLDGQDFKDTVFNFMLPRGTMLNAGTRQNPSDDSSAGLGGYHSSIHTQGNTPVTIYYAVCVFSDILDGGQNGIVVFDKPWKNMVATFYHELNEARTDADVGDATDQDESPIGWYCDSTDANNIPPGPNGNKVGGEIGDIPIDEAQIFAGNDLSTIFKEVLLTDGTGKVPIQFMYSNVVHGPGEPNSGTT